MLNRRILRVKAFQTLYAYQQCKFSNANLAQDYIREAFLPDLNTMEVQDKGQLKRDAERCVQHFLSHLQKDTPLGSGETDEKIKHTAIKAVDLYHKYNQKDKDFLKSNMLTAVENIPGLYIYAIHILLEFGAHVKNEKDKKRKYDAQPVMQPASFYNLGVNKALQIIGSNHSFRRECSRFQVNSGELELEIKEWFRVLIKPNEEYQTYITIDNPSFEQDKEILQSLLKKVLFKSEAVISFFQEKDINWAENKSIVRSLASKVIKNLSGEEDSSDEILPELALNWEEDKEFFQNIFNLTIGSEEEFSGMISQKTKNWDVERIALTDKVILTMALTEMVNFPSIPTKVSINEYIDISKTYSTPKSKQFVNGLLDTLSKELTESGKIRKSGRGLIDNK